MLQKLIDKVAPIFIITTIITGLTFLYWGIYTWAGAMLGLSIILGFFIFFDDIRIIKNADKKFMSRKDRLKKQGKKIKINLNDADLTSNSWSEEVIVNHSKTGALNQISGRGDLNINVVSNHKNSISFNVPFNNQTLQICHEIDMEIKTLQMKLVLQKETSLYVNPENTNEYYLDMEFLNE